jgi:hypothetical protein
MSEVVATLGPCVSMVMGGDDHCFYPHSSPFTATRARSPVTQKRKVVSPEPLPRFPINDDNESGRWRRGKPLKP